MKILSMSGFVPEQICDTVRFTQYHGDRNISHYCGYASDFISQVLHDKDIDGAVFPKSCDSARIIPSYLSGTGKFVHQLNVPPYRASGAITYFADSIRRYMEAVENHYGVLINDLNERTDLVNDRNRKIKELYENIGGLSFADYLSMIHELLNKPLREQGILAEVKESKGGKPVYCIGSFLANINVAKKVEEAGLNVVGDTFTESGRLASTPVVDKSGDIFQSIAASILSARMSPTRNAFEKIIEADTQEIKHKGAKGLIFITQKYCEPYDFLFSAYKAAMDSMGIPILQISLSDTEDDRKIGLALEAFADTI